MKRSRIYLLLIPTFLLSSCTFILPINKKSSSEEKSSSENESSILPPLTEKNLLFTEFYVGETYANRAVEISNISEKEIDLSKYYLNVYRDGGGENAKPNETIQLNGLLKKEETYIIVYSNADDVLLNKADLITDQFLNDGTFPMTITNEYGQVVDEIGYIGYFYDIAHKSDTVRKLERMTPGSFSPYDWIRYPTSNLDNLGNLNCVGNDVLFKGPKLTQEDFNTPYTTDGSTGEGGAVEVSLSYTIDGDTTKFIFPSSLSSYGISGSNSVRYYGINTPEIAHGENPADPYGPEAKDFTNAIIRSSKHYVVQSIKGYSLTETYDRMLGYVWVTDKSNPNPEDYFLLNHYIVQNGYARIGHITRGGYNDYMTHLGVSYVEYLYDAQQYAIENKLHIYEEGL